MKTETKKIVAKTGNEAAAYAMKQINPDVVAAYPITPSTEIIQIFSKYVADGEVDTEFIPVESEHSAISVCIGASASGARVMTATSSQGLALMHEILYIASSLRLPIVMIVGNRALSGPINIHCDHSDTMGSRDSGWIQIYCENANEVYHTIINAVKISEKVNLPCMVTMDGFIVTHGMENVLLLEDEEVREFLGKREPLYSILDVKNPITVGPLALYDYYMEHKRSQLEAILKSKKIIDEVFEEYNRKFELNIPSFIEEYFLDDAEIAVIAMSSAAGTLKEAVDLLREKGERVGILKLKITRPFPYEILRKKLENVKVAGVMDRAETFSTMGGPVSIEVKAALYPAIKKPVIQSFMFGLGGREFSLDDAFKVFDILKKIKKENKIEEEFIYIGLRE
ncbi:MAG: pyruvate ferredoxin oxidoreductase [candidate division WOR-3 bacterium]